MSKREKNEILEEMNCITSEIYSIANGLNIIENGLLYAEERKDKDMRLAAASAISLFASIAEEYADSLQNIMDELRRE